MSEYEDEYDDQEFEQELGGLSEEELMIIQADYRRQKLKENLIGPVISTMFHVVLLVLCAIFFVGEVSERNETVEITPVAEETPKEEPPPPPPPPEIPPPEPQEVVSHDPQVTSDAVPDAADLIGAIDDVSDEPPSTDDSAEADLVSDVKPSASSIVSAKMFGGRSSAGRAGALKSYGGSVAAQNALHKALKWLASVQNPDGSWDGSANAGAGQKPAGMAARFDGKMNAAPIMKNAGGGKPSFRDATGLTGLALLVFLAHGETPKSKTYGNTVSKAINWLVNDPVKKETYSNAIKAYALSEAYAMTGNYAIQEPLTKFMETLVKGQQKSGGYDYAYKADEGRQDLSAAGWNYQAMKAAKGAHIEVEGLEEAIELSIQYLKKGGASSSDGKGFSYDMAKGPSNNSRMRAVGVLCLQLFGEGEAKEIEDELNVIATADLKALSWNNPPPQSLYGWYYATQTMFQAGGKMWKAWNTVFQKELKNNQNPVGYWDFPGKVHGPKTDLGMKIYATCFASLMLTVYYRYLPMTAKGGAKKKAVAKKPTAKEKAKAVGEEEIDIF